ncbi:hypothetical protein GMRT_12506 [Giardia muris]|uniref:Uncharacterized protein n=1 Tax=Giardia muris TaxID=5742 RepID=A0A4Z1SQ34_GIAMU|nr:hypothetical protein GMRT_12506 [Giardia muris]|eukprot:TNJ27944.1 hypothetical protein GMRT_12506 [Giardia muris]
MRLYWHPSGKALIAAGVPAAGYGLVMGIVPRRFEAVPTILDVCLHVSKDLFRCLEVLPAEERREYIHMAVLVGVAVATTILGLVLGVVTTCGVGTWQCVRQAYRVVASVGVFSLADCLILLTAGGVRMRYGSKSVAGDRATILGEYLRPGILILGLVWVLLLVIGPPMLAGNSCILRLVLYLIGLSTVFFVIFFVIKGNPLKVAYEVATSLRVTGYILSGVLCFVHFVQLIISAGAISQKQSTCCGRVTRVPVRS